MTGSWDGVRFMMTGRIPSPQMRKPACAIALPDVLMAISSVFGANSTTQIPNLPEEFLKEVCLASTGKDRDGVRWLKLPYKREDGKTDVFRKRYGGKEFRWSYGSSGKLCLYGEWRLPEIQKNGYAVLVEGESDTQTLWYLNIAALGVPGASNFKARMVPKLEGLKIYLHVEPDKGGETFLEKVFFTKRSFPGMSSHGAAGSSV